MLVIAIIADNALARTQCNLIDRCSDHAANRNHHRLLARSDIPRPKVALFDPVAGLVAVLLFYLLSITSLPVTAWQIVIVIALVIAFWLLADAAAAGRYSFFRPRD